jgi:hypothetical protein
MAARESEGVRQAEKGLLMQAINRQPTHYADHVGRIVHLARHSASERCKSPSVPKGAQRNSARHRKAIYPGVTR